MTLGEKHKWLFWYGFAFIFEKVTSLWFGNQLYTELAMSAIEAGGLTMGLFLADRITMMFEPETLWTPRSKSDALAYSTSQSLAKQIPESASLESAFDLNQKTWVRERVEIASAGVAKKVELLKEKTVDAVSDVSAETKKKVSGFRNIFQNIFEARRARKEAAKQVRKAEQKKRVDRFNDLTKGY